MYHSALQSRTGKTQLIIEQMSFECLKYFQQQRQNKI